MLIFFSLHLHFPIILLQQMEIVQVMFM